MGEETESISYPKHGQKQYHSREYIMRYSRRMANLKKKKKKKKKEEKEKGKEG